MPPTDWGSPVMQPIHVRVSRYPRVTSGDGVVLVSHAQQVREFSGADPRRVLDAAIDTMPEDMRREMRQKLRSVLEGERDTADYVRRDGLVVTVVVTPTEIVA